MSSPRSAVALSSSEANWPSGVLDSGFGGGASGDPNTRSPGKILFEILRGGLENACIPFARLLGELSGPSDCLGRVSGLAEALSEGLNALRSRSPSTLGSFGWSSLLIGCRLGDLLSARSSASGFDRARLALVGDWYDGRLRRDPSCERSGTTGAPVVSLVFRRLAGESIVAGVPSFSARRRR